LNKLNITEVFNGEAKKLLENRENSIKIHGTGDIRAAGDEVEKSVRDFFQSMVPKNIYVTQGHLIDENGIISRQIDIIFADKTNLPSLMTTKNGTEYIPISSVYAIGEIKSSYYKSGKYIEYFSNALSEIKSEMYNPEIINTAYEGKMDDSTLMRDIFLCKGNKVLNRIFSFMLFLDKGDFKLDNIKTIIRSGEKTIFPDITVFLDLGTILYAKNDDEGLSATRYPEQVNDSNYHWYLAPFVSKSENNGSLAGCNLGFLYYSILEHINNSFLEPPNLRNFLIQMQYVIKSKIQYLE
jgi:hypothetical protein